MVDVQTIGVLVTAVSVTIAAAYYVINLRETNKNRRITLTITMMQPFMTEQGVQQLIDILSMNWSNYDDFYQKYDSRFNPSSYAKRMSMWTLCENFGRLYREELIDLETLYGGSAFFPQLLWAKFKPVIDAMRGKDLPMSIYGNWEYMVGELNKYHLEKFGEDYGAKLEGLVQDHKGA